MEEGISEQVIDILVKHKTIQWSLGLLAKYRD
jgi:hypothetical protein